MLVCVGLKKSDNFGKNATQRNARINSDSILARFFALGSCAKNKLLHVPRWQVTFSRVLERTISSMVNYRA